ncbi:hypothetical protein ABTM32_22385, partial [Acinetobacter baumannii]
MHKVIVNNKRGAYDATSQLIKNGFKNIACIASSSYLSISKERIQGYIDALQENNIKVNDELIAYCAHGGMLYDEV